MKKVTKRIKIIAKALYWLTFAVLISIAALVAISAIDIPGNYKLLSVQSGSMETSIAMGSVIVTKPSNDYRIGDVISYFDSDDNKYLITHRVSAIEYLEDGKLYITKGDANEDADRERVDEGLVVGKVIWALPFLGYVVSYAKTQVGLIFLIVIPATLLVYSEVLAIKSEIIKLKGKNRNRKKFFKKYSITKLLGLTLLLIVIQTSGTSSSYVDIERSTGNTMTAGVWDVGNEEAIGSEEEEVELLFYLRSDELAVGFVIQGVTGYDSLEYVIEYEHDGGVLEHVEGTIDNSGHTDAFLREWFELGSCSAGGICIYHEGIEVINLEIDLVIGGGVNDTLNRTITF